MTDLDPPTCPKCGAPISAGGPTGLCPRCLPSGTQGGQSPDAPDSPSFAQRAHRKRWIGTAAAVIGAIFLGRFWLGNTHRSDAVAHYNRANALTRQGNLDEATAEFRAAIRIEPDFAEAHYNLGVALGRQGKLDEATAEYRAAIRIKPDDATAHHNLGLALIRQGKLDEAVTEFRAAIRIKPGYAKARYNLGVALRREGNPEEAIAELGKARDKAPRGSELEQSIEKALNEIDH